MSIKDSSLFLCSRSSNHHAILSNRLSLASSRNILACPVLSSFPLPPYLESPLDFDCFILRGDQDQTPPPSVPSSLVADIWASLKHPPTSEVRDTYNIEDLCCLADIGDVHILECLHRKLNPLFLGFLCIHGTNSKDCSEGQKRTEMFCYG